MAASTGMIKGKKPLEIIWNNYNMAITALALLQFLSRFLPSKESIETFPSTICVHQRAHEKYQEKHIFQSKQQAGPALCSH